MILLVKIGSRNGTIVKQTIAGMERPDRKTLYAMPSLYAQLQNPVALRNNGNIRIISRGCGCDGADNCTVAVDAISRNGAFRPKAVGGCTDGDSIVNSDAAKGLNESTVNPPFYILSCSQAVYAPVPMSLRCLRCVHYKPSPAMCFAEQSLH
jgi:hypothetical protein